MDRKRVIIMGAAGRDFHNFNTYFRDDLGYEVVAFTAAQIPNIDERRYPSELAGEHYPRGIEIFPEEMLPELVRDLGVDQVIFAYSDISHEEVMHHASEVMRLGADFVILGNQELYIKARVPVISVTAVRTGSGKSPTTRFICNHLKTKGKRVVAIRHPMPYGDLVRQRVQRFDSMDDLDAADCTIEEREEFEPLIESGIVVYAGVDYQAIVDRAETEADVIVWDGGNNDVSFLRSNLYITVADPHRIGHETRYHPGEANVRMADIVMINKVDSVDRDTTSQLVANILAVNPYARIIEAESLMLIDDPEEIMNRRVLVVEDGPTVTHGGMGFGVGLLVAEKSHAKEIVDPRPYAVGTIREAYEQYGHLERVLPALGYSKGQLDDLRETILSVPCDVVVSGTPVDLRRLIKIDKPIVRVRYGIGGAGCEDLRRVLDSFIRGEMQEHYMHHGQPR